MKQYLKQDEWCIIEEGFHQQYNRISESIFSIGNGRMGQRANFEEKYSGNTLQGNYIAGVYYPDKTRVGWWKNGYPEYFAKVLNAANWIGIDIEFDGEALDLVDAKVNDFRRVLNMKDGYLERSFTAKMKSGRTVKVSSKRFCSIVEDQVGAIRYSITPLDFDGTISISPYLDADVFNEDSNYDEKFWVEIDKKLKRTEGYIVAETKKTAFQVCTGMKISIEKNNKTVDYRNYKIKRKNYVAVNAEFEFDAGDEIVVYKYAANLSSLNNVKEDLLKNCKQAVKAAYVKGFNALLTEQAIAWAKKWASSDIIIEGDISAQQAIRFNIFQLHQTYTGEDERLNIGPKGFTGEKYGGSTYWDTEAYCLPFYLSTTEEKVAKNLLIYRYKHLAKAIENATKLGFTAGAALYPMVTMNGEECHNEWEITFEEIHRNGAISFAIYDYIRYTGDKDYLLDYGLEVLIGIARFWAQRVHFSVPKQQYVMHGVTGPNEYENNINNNWYTSYIAVWCLKYTLEAISYVEETNADKFVALEEKIKFYKYTETKVWKEIIDKMYLPQDEKKGIFLQQEGFLDKDIKPASKLLKEDRPIHQKWSWDRILRSCYIKQADVLQGIYCFEDQFDIETIRRNFNFYEPLTVHESSLSPCVHAILAAKLGQKEKAYEMYLRTARLDLDDYNNDTEDGCHITSMAGTWMAIVKGFGGMRIADNILQFSPFIPDQWQSYTFSIRYRQHSLNILVDKKHISITNHCETAISLKIFEKIYTINANEKIAVAYHSAKA